jgi:hypothetical protein
LAKVTLNTIGSRYGSIDALNANFDAIEAAFENTLSRDGDVPNFMMTPIDMNGYAIINVSSIMSGGVNIIEKLNQDYVTYSGDMTSIYNNYISITQRVTISTAAPSGGSDGDIWFRVSA